MNEEKLIQTAQNLGARAAERLDVAATARAVVERLREQPVRRTTWVQSTWLRIAAAFVLVVGGGLVVRSLVPSPEAPVPSLIADDLRDLSTDDLRTLLITFDQIIDESVVPDSTADLPELDAQQLRQLLREG
jgi:hypothetical protein